MLTKTTDETAEKCRARSFCIYVQTDLAVHSLHNNHSYKCQNKGYLRKEVLLGLRIRKTFFYGRMNCDIVLELYMEVFYYYIIPTKSTAAKIFDSFIPGTICRVEYISMRFVEVVSLLVTSIFCFFR